jgi:serine/threonine protein kinase/Flp pilus assembly protein TadD
MPENNKDDKIQAYLALSQGVMVGRYCIIKPLGSGGMGDVYLAEDKELNRRVALKFLSVMLGSDDTCKARFTREAQTAAKLNHPNIVTIYEVGEIRGRPFMAMEYVEGQSLKELIAKKELPLEQAIEIVTQISQGLGEAHAAGIIHRDVKPANILIDKKWRAKILDFGLAVVEGCEALTKTGSTIGTVSYMSPEQVLGKELDFRSDIFSLGIVFYEMLTGHLPFKGDHEAVMMYAIANEEPEPLRTYKPDLTDNIQTLIDLLLSKNPDRRIQSATDLLANLGQVKDLSASIVPSGPAKKSIAIMYFQDFTKSEDISWLSKGIPHMLITSLEQSVYLDVVSYQRLFDILNQMGKADVETISMAVATEVAKRARATMMVTGCVFKYGNSIRLDYQINDVASGHLTKAGKVVGEEPFAVADELGSQIRENLEIQETGAIRRNIADVTTHSLEAYKYYLEGIDHWNRAHYDPAAKCFNKAIAFDSTFAMAYYWMAWVKYFSEGSPGDYLEKVAKHSKNLSQKELHYIKSQDAFFRANFIKGKEHLDPIVADFPEEKEPYLRMWFIFPNPEDSKELIRSIRKVLVLDPHYREGQRGLFFAYLNAGKIDYALNRANKYMSLFPREADPYGLLGEIYSYAGEWGKSIEAVQKALRLKNDEYRYIMHLGAIHQCTDRFQKAEEYYLKLRSIDDTAARLMGIYYLGQLACYRGRFNEALKIFNNAIASNSSDAANRIWLSRMHLAKLHIYSEMGQFDEALEEYYQSRKILEALSSQSNTKIGIGWYQVQLLASKGIFDEAHKMAMEIKDAIEGSIPHWVSLYYIMEAIISAEKKDFQVTRKYLSQIDWKYINPNRMQIDFVIARLLLCLGDAEEASKLLKQLQSICHFNKAYWSVLMARIPYLLGVAYEALGKSENAMVQFQKYLKIREDADPGIPEVEDAKVRLAKLKIQA